MLALPGLFRLHLRLDGRSLVHPDSPALALDREIQATFGTRDPIVLLLDAAAPDGIFDAEFLRWVRQVSLDIRQLEGVEGRDVVSLATQSRDRVDSIDTRPYLVPLPETPADFESLRADLEAAAIPLGILVGQQWDTAAVWVRVPPQIDRAALVSSLERLVAASAEDAPGRAWAVGAPVAEVLLGRHLLLDLLWLLPLSFALIAAVLWGVFRRPWAILLALGEVAAGIVFTFGLLGWSGQPVYLTTAILPIVLATLGLTDEIHVLSACQRRVRRSGPGLSHSSLAARVLDDLARPMVLTSATTVIGFLSFLASDLPSVRSFGLWAAVGIAFCLAWSLWLTPAAVRVLGAERLVAPGEGWLESPLRRVLERASVGRGAWVVLFGGLFLIVAGAGRIAVQDGWVSGFAAGSEFRRGMERANESLLGTHRLLARVTFAEGKKPFHDPAVLHAVGSFEDRLRREPSVGGVLGPFGYLSSITYLAKGRPSADRAPPDSAEYIRRMWRRMELGLGIEGRREVVTDERDGGLVTLLLGEANYRDTRDLIERIRTLEEDHLAPLGGRVDLGGDVAVSQAMIGSIVRGQLASLTVALVGIFFFLWLVFGRFALALRAILPSSAAGAVALGVMGWSGIPLGVATSMFLAIALGVGVDFAIHWIEWQRREGHSAARAAVGPAILVDTLAIALGFGLLIASRVPANARLGLLVALAIVVSCGVTVFGREKKRGAIL
ncbi:MAG: MMPL family transporter [Acidobacteriota bacterium]